jgi:hypothetical protein
MADAIPQPLLAAAGLASQDSSQLRVLSRRAGTPLWGFPVQRSSAHVTWRALRELTAQTGYYPIILADGNLLDESIASEESPPDLIEKSGSVDAASFLRERAAEALYGEQPDFDNDDPRAEQNDRFATLTSDLWENLNFLIALIPTRNPWEVFAHLGYGGWNEYPFAHQHVAIMKYWHQRYVAEPVVVTDDVIEMVVDRPPSAPAACRELALEQFGYTFGDLVNQGYQRFGALARVLNGLHHWYFWWD